MTTAISTTSPAFWNTVADHVAARVTSGRKMGLRTRGPIIAYLRDLEGIARRECDSRQAIQIIASGRHLLGDMATVEPADGPFSHI